MTESDLVDSALPLAVSICLAFLCALGSAIFSGLTLGLLTLDLVQLKLVIDRPKETRADEINSRYARRILPLRKDGNYLLVTLLAGNVAVNAGFSLLLGGLTDGLVGFLVSTVVITIFGEILPQAICARHGLKVGGNLAWFVWLLEWVLYPVVKPIALALNYMLGEDIGTIYDRKQLRALVEYHDNVVHVLTSDEARILKGGLDFAFVRVDKVMTPIEQVYGLEIDTKLTFDRISRILSCGFSRIPVLDSSSPQCIVGLLYMKDLALFDPYAEGTFSRARAPASKKGLTADTTHACIDACMRSVSAVEVRTLLHLFGRNVYAVDDDTALLDLLTAFKKGHTHLAVVRSVVNTGEGDPYYRHVGIITLEDIIEEILQDEIHDEFDHEKQQQQTEPATTPSSLTDLKKACSVPAAAAAAGVGGEKKQLLALEEEGPSAVEASTLPTNASSSVVIPMTGVLALPSPAAAAAEGGEPHQRRGSRGDKHWGSCNDCMRPQLLGCGVSKALAADRRPLKMISHALGNVSPPKEGGQPVDEHTILRGRMKLIDKGRVGSCLSRSEALAVSTFLCCAERCFQPPHVSPRLLLVLLQHMRPVRLGSGVQIFTRGSRAYHAALVLQGRLKLEVGSERIACRVGPWTTLAMHCLNFSSVPQEFEKKRQKLQEKIGEKDLSCYGFQTTTLHGYAAQQDTSSSSRSNGRKGGAECASEREETAPRSERKACGLGPESLLLPAEPPQSFSPLHALPLLTHPPACASGIAAGGDDNYVGWGGPLSSDLRAVRPRRLFTRGCSNDSTIALAAAAAAAAASSSCASSSAVSAAEERGAEGAGGPSRVSRVPGFPPISRWLFSRDNSAAAATAAAAAAAERERGAPSLSLTVPPHTQSAPTAEARPSPLTAAGDTKGAAGERLVTEAAERNSNSRSSNSRSVQSKRLLGLLLPARACSYRESRRRSLRSRGAFCPLCLSDAEAPDTPGGFNTSWAPSPRCSINSNTSSSSSSSKSPFAAEASISRRSTTSLRSTKPPVAAAAATTAAAAEKSEAVSSVGSCSYSSSYVQCAAAVCSSVSSSAAGGSELEGVQRIVSLDTFYPHTAAAATRLIRAADHGLVAPSSILRLGDTRPLLANAEEPSPTHQQQQLQQLQQQQQQQPVRLQQFCHHRVSPRHNPLRQVSPGSAADAATGRRSGAAAAAAAGEPVLSLQQQLEAQDSQLRELVRLLSLPLENAMLLRLLAESGWSEEETKKAEGFFNEVVEGSAYYPDFSSRTGSFLSAHWWQRPACK
ncbi:hypothetical protein Esti_002120 [Eimeria stiedai]